MKIASWFCCCCTFSVGWGVMFKKVCPPEEVHRSCSFYEEITCWAKNDRLERVKIAPQRMAHCKSGCFCKRAYVREYPRGPCIQGSSCRDQKLKLMLEKLSKELYNFNQ